ncbi:ligand-binding SRPBCC domain-containing protein [Gracilibacillus halotolerans]|uniref:Ligand-binding SRPBCC domain-containing protein n=1 Tax=Gracilibacillus halotolerans TaxID=74386 RepID=A0A841RJ43_9BACI|nr:SRPBCC family protein [Gracilibacillus halotolerans]MBB6512701.1 ligand-binding SRPBCC domain-containing protein [Gracilibacillus halotolerans]
MPVIKHMQFIQAPVDVCFDLARNVDIHIQTSAKTKEKAIEGVTTGLLEKDDSVTWEATHFGINQKLTAKVIEMEKPTLFIDTMVKGAFHSFVHTHEFIQKDNGTLMIDTFDYRSPFGLVGRIADKLFLEKYMTDFISSRAKALKEIAEKNE